MGAFSSHSTAGSYEDKISTLWDLIIIIIISSIMNTEESFVSIATFNNFQSRSLVFISA